MLVLGLPSAFGDDGRARELIRFLRVETERPDGEAIRSGLFTCGQTTANREAAMELAGLGGAALPEVERELAGMAGMGESAGFGSDWILLAYARIRGRDGFARLRGMSHRVPGLEGAMALSKGVTSYVLASRPPGRRFFCSREGEPRDALDLLLLGWMRRDGGLIAASLGTAARAAKVEWAGGADGGAAIGYRFQSGGRWAEPEETLERERSAGEAAEVGARSRWSIGTVFLDASGNVCGHTTLQFQRVAPSALNRYLSYRIDRVDLGAVGRIVSSCLAGGR